MKKKFNWFILIQIVGTRNNYVVKRRQIYFSGFFITSSMQTCAAEGL
jgi:hypothetical protein